MKFDVFAYQNEVARRFNETNNEIFQKFMYEKGYFKDDKFAITDEQRQDPEFQKQFVAELEAVDFIDIEFTEEELKKYFIE